jgi:ribosomal protein L11 methyltransferase
VTAAEAELAADHLWRRGAVAVGEEVDGERVVLTCAFTDDAVLEAAVGALAHRGATVVEVDDGLDAWREHAEAVHVGERLLVVPTWRASADGAEVVVRIDPERAFGSGAHATTRLVLAELITRVRPGDRVLDLGCGSGVVAIVAARFGASEVTGVDIDDHALAVTVANAARNGVTVTVAASLADVDGPFDLVVANVLAPVLLELAPLVRDRLAESATVVVSGVLHDRWHHVAEALVPLAVTATQTLDGWDAVVLSTPANSVT